MPLDPGTGGYTPPKHKHKKKSTPLPYFGPSDIATAAVRQNRTPFRLPPSPAQRAARHEVRQRRKNAKIAAARAHVEAAQNAIENLRAASRVGDQQQPAISDVSELSPIATARLQGRALPDVLNQLNIIDQTVGELGTAALYSPAAAFQLAKGGVQDIGDILQAAEHDIGGRPGEGDYTPTRSLENVEAMGRGIATDIRHPGRHPGYTLFDALGIGAGIAGLATRGAAGLSAGLEARGPARLSQALARPTHEGGSLLRKPPPGRVEIAPGVYHFYSSNPLAKLFQKEKLKRQQKKPESHVAGIIPGRNLPERQGKAFRAQERIEQDTERARAEALKKEAKKAGKEKQYAVGVVAEQAPINARIRTLLKEKSEATGSSPSAILKRNRLERRITLLEKIADRGLVSENGVGPYKIVPGPEIERLVKRTEGSVERTEATLKELGLMTEAKLKVRRDKPGKVFAGAEYVKPTPGKRGIPSAKLIAKRQRVERLEKIHAKSLERAAKKAKPYETVKVPGELQKVERPRTEAEARALVKKLDDLEETQLKAIEEHLTGGQKADMADVRLRNRENAMRFKKSGGKRGNAERLSAREGGGKLAGKQKTVKQELRDMAQAELDKALRSKDPEMQKLAAAMAERDRLKAELNDPEAVFGEGLVGMRARQERELGKKKETIRVKTTIPSDIPPKGTFTPTTERLGSALSVARDELERLEARAARAQTATGLVGGEGAAPGRFYSPGAERRRGAAAMGRAQVGTAKVLGVPRPKKVLGGTYTGVSARSGLDPIKRVRAQAEQELRVQHLRTVVRTVDYARKESIGPEEFLALPEGTRKHFIEVRMPKINKKTGEPTDTAIPYSNETREFLDKIEQRASEGLDLTRKEKKELKLVGDKAIDYFFQGIGDAEAAAARAAETGEVRFVDARKLGKANQPATKYPSLDFLGTAFDEINAATQLAVLFAKPAYLVPNLIGQAALAIFHQGFMAPANLYHAGEAWKNMTREERMIVRGGIDEGLARGAQYGGRVFGPTRDIAAGAYGKVLDAPFRWPAFIAEARKLGYKTTEDYTRLLVGKDKKTHGDRLEAFQRTRNAMVDYSDLTPFESRVMRRAVFFYPWVKGSTVYTGRFLRDHPIWAMALAQQGKEAKAYVDKILGPRPFYARGLVPTGGTDAQGNPLVSDPTAAGLFGYPTQIAEAIKRFAEVDPKAGYDIADFLSPAAAAIGQAFFPHDPLQGYQLDSSIEGLKRQFVTGLPQSRLIQGAFPGSRAAKWLSGGKTLGSDDLYPSSSATAWKRYTLGSVWPHPVNKATLNKLGRDEGADNLTTGERAFRKVFEDRKAVLEAVKKYRPQDLQNGRLAPSIREAYNRKAGRDAMLAVMDSRTEAGQEREKVKYQGEVALLKKWGVLKGSIVPQALAWASSASYDDLRTARNELSDRYFETAYLGLLNDVHVYLEAKGATFGG